MLTREEIIAKAVGLQPVDIEIPEWGGKFKLLPLSGTQFEELEAIFQQANEMKDYHSLRGIRGKIATWCVADQEGKPLFKSSDAKVLTDKYREVLQRILDVVLLHSGITSGTVSADANAILDGLEKN